MQDIYQSVDTLCYIAVVYVIRAPSAGRAEGGDGGELMQRDGGAAGCADGGGDEDKGGGQESSG